MAYVECATEPMVITQVDAQRFDLVILTARPPLPAAWGLRDVKDEIYRCPPILVPIGRPVDGWLATWSRADAVEPTRWTSNVAKAQPTCLSDVSPCPPRNPIATAKPSVTMTDSSWTWLTVLAAAMSETSVLDGVAAIDRILDDQATSAQIAAFVTAPVRGESPEQVRALVDSMMERVPSTPSSDRVWSSMLSAPATDRTR